MLAWESCDMVRASRSKRSFRLGLETKCPERTLMATSRPRRVSRARYTSPMPPAPNCPVTSYGPNLVPVVIIGLYARGDVSLRRAEGGLHLRLIQIPENQRGNAGAHDGGSHEEGIEVHQRKHQPGGGAQHADHGKHH